MKTLILIFLLISVKSVSQDFVRTFDISGDQYILTVAAQPDGSRKVGIKQGSNVIVDENLNPFTFQQFKNLVAPKLRTATPSVTSTDLEAIVQNLFYDSIAWFLSDGSEKGPQAGVINISSSVKVYKNVSKSYKGRSYTNDGILDIKSVELEVNEGFIENINVITLDSTGAERVFSNQFGIGFASKNNMDNLKKYDLFEKDRTKTTNPTNWISLGELIRYDITLEPGRRDYSPEDKKYHYILDKGNHTSKMYKSPAKRLIEARVFSDFIGLDQNKPNGLIQTEVSKRINTNTNRTSIFHKKCWFNNIPKFILGQGGGIFQYVTPTLVLSKIEENNKDLIVRRNRDFITDQEQIMKKPIFNQEGVQTGEKDTVIINKSIEGRPYLTALEVIRHQNFSAGVDANVAYSENIAGKFNFYLDAGMRFGRTSVADSLTNIEQFTNALGGREYRIVKSGFVNRYGINTFQIYPELKIQWLPDERFGVSLSHKWTYFRIWNGDPENRYLAQKNMRYFTESSASSSNNRAWLNSWEIFAFLKLADPGKLFFRYRMTYELGEKKHNFIQAQVGYSFYIVGNRNPERKSGE